MAGISWIKLSVNIFDDEKIKLIRSMPEGDSIILIWIQLLCLAGKTNDNGAVYMGQNMYYTDEMLSTICDQPLNTIRLALETFRRFGMIEHREDGLITIENWGKHQNIEGLEKIKIDNAERQRLYYWRKKLLSVGIDSYQDDFTDDVEEMKRLYEEKSLTLGLTSPHALDKIREDENRLDETRLDKNRSDKNRSDKDHHDDTMPDSSPDTWKSQIINFWNRLDVNIPKMQSLNAGTDRYKMTKARINENGIDKVLDTIKSIDDSTFLKGYVNDFVITFDWFIRPNNFVKVMEGNYLDKSKTDQGVNSEQITYAEVARKKRFEKMLENKKELVDE